MEPLEAAKAGRPDVASTANAGAADALCLNSQVHDARVDHFLLSSALL